MNTDCRHCKEEMPDARIIRINKPPMMQIHYEATGWKCVCGHWNDLKRRKAGRGKRK